MIGPVSEPRQASKEVLPIKIHVLVGPSASRLQSVEFSSFKRISKLQASWWTLALDFLSEMFEMGGNLKGPCLPNLFTFNAAITACANGFQWARSVALLSDLEAECLQPDTITFNALIVAFQKACFQHGSTGGQHWKTPRKINEDPK